VLLHEEALNLILRSDAGITALVASRIFPGTAPQTAAYPALAYRLTDREPQHRLEARGSAGLVRSRYRLYSGAKGHPGASSAYGDSKRLDEAVRLALTGFHGLVSNQASPANTLEVQGIFPEITIEYYDDLTQVWNVATDFDFYAPMGLPVPLAT
jgi:hypothetical protein